MKQQDNNPILLYAVITMAACMMVTVCVMIIAVFIATQRPNIVIVPIEQVPRETAPAQVVAIEPESVEELFPGLRVVRTTVLPPLVLTDSADWNNAPAYTVMTLPQQDEWPKLDEGTVSEVEVRAMTDGNYIDWRLEWQISKPSTRVDSTVFSDAAAIQLPMTADASYMMGDVNQPVYLVYWRAQWQEDIERGFPEVANYYPNYWTDLYWSTKAAYNILSIPELIEDSLGRQYFIAHEAGNPFSVIDRNSPIQELIAEGFGSLSPIPETMAMGNAVWSDGTWKLVIRMPIDEKHPIHDVMNNEDMSMFSIAIWDGNAQNVGGRKNHSVWIPMEIE